MSQKIDIVVSDKTGTRSATPQAQTTASATSNAVPPTEEGLTNMRQVKSIALATMVAQRAFSYTTSNIGKWVGDSHVQNQINMIGEAIGIGALAYINPALAGVNVALNIATTAADYAWENKWDKRRSNQELTRLGYSSKGEMLGRKR